MSLKFMYITNRPDVAAIADKYGVDRVWIDLETLGKQERQANVDSVKSHHEISDVSKVKPRLKKAELLVRVNPINPGSKKEIDEVIDAGADIVMLPMWKSAAEVSSFLRYVGGRVKTTLLLETKEAAECLDEVLELGGFDEIHIGLNDLHLSYGLTFMFELLSDGTVEKLCNKIAAYGIPYGFGGIAGLGQGMLPAEKILIEHYRLGSTRVILSRSFCDADKIGDVAKIDNVFRNNLSALRAFETKASEMTDDEYLENHEEITNIVARIVKAKKESVMTLNYEKLNGLAASHGDAFYLLDSAQFRKNYRELKAAFTAVYPNFNIAYSYKTNYTPALCKIVNEEGGFAEVVSDMEVEIALKSGVSPDKIIWNGPYKNSKAVGKVLLAGGSVNIDSVYELNNIEELARENPDKTLNIGLRCNFDVNDGVTSRFGLDVESEDFKTALSIFNRHKNLKLICLQCHFATRSLKTWKPRASGMIKLIDELGVVPERIDLGGGLFGKMADSLKKQFDSEIPTYSQYVNEIAPLFKERFGHLDNPPTLLVEPGSALVGDCMKFAARVVSIKSVRGKSIATLLGSIYNINPTLNKKNPPLEVYSGATERKTYKDLDFGGFTCIESDYLYRHYDGELAVGDFVVFGNVGSYSVVLKPPFILPNFAVLDICDGDCKVIKRRENFDDLFHTFVF